MDYLKINYEELSALSGLPHLQQLLYLRGIKPFVDHRTGLVGVRRGISYQSLSEELYVEPHQGIKSGSPSKDQIRRAIKGLEKAGILQIQSLEWKLIFQCLLVSLPSSDSNKAALNQHEDSARNWPEARPCLAMHNAKSSTKPATSENDKAAIPQGSNIYVCVLAQFEIFWEMYPKKNSRQKAFEEFQRLNLSDELMSHILTALKKQIDANDILQSQGQWTPKWKFPANWLAQQCWNDEVPTSNPQGERHEIHPRSAPKQHPVDLLWESCKSGATFTSSNHAPQS